MRPLSRPFYSIRRSVLRGRRRHAFTLMELLLVIAVVAVLLLLSLGVFGSIRKSGDSAKCLQNMRTTGLAMISFFQDNNGAFFPTKSWFQYPSTRPIDLRGMRDYFGIGADSDPILSPVFKVDSMLTCPAVKRLRPQYYSGAEADPFYRGFAINIWLNVKSTTGDWGNTPWAQRPFKDYALLRMQAVPSPSRMFILTETPFNPSALGSVSESIIDEGKRYMLYPHANMTQHVLFLDGHIESLTEAQFKNPTSMRDFWGNTSHAQ